jgi:hypothetical protein
VIRSGYSYVHTIGYSYISIYTLNDDALFFNLGSVHQFSKIVILKSYMNFLDDIIKKRNKLIKVLSDVVVDKKRSSIAVQETLKAYLDFENTSEKKDKKTSITLRINRNEKADFIDMLSYYQKAIPDNSTGLTTVIRILLYQYTKHSRIEREMILFGSQYGKIKRAIKEKYQISIVTQDNKVITMKPYKLILFGDECQFLVGDKVSSNDTISIRLSRIIDISHHDYIHFESITDETVKMVENYESNSFQYDLLGKHLDDENVLSTLIMLQKRKNF